MSSPVRRTIAPFVGFALALTALPAAAQFMPMDVITRIPADQVITGVHNAINLALPQLVIKTSAGPLNTLALSPSGRWLVTAPGDKVLRLWDLENGVEAARLFGMSGQPAAVAVGDGRVAAADGTNVRIWSASSGREERAIAGAQAATSLAFAGADKLMVGRADGSIAEISVADGRELRVFPGHRGNVSAMVTTPDGKTLVSGDAAGTVYIWDLAAGSGAGGGVVPDLTALAVAPDGSGFASGQKDGTVTLWSRAGQPLGKSVKHKGAVTSLSYSANGAIVASAGGEKAVRLSDVAKKAEVKGYEVHTADATAVAFEPRFGRLFSGGKDGIVRVTDISSDPPKPLLRMVSTSKGWAALDDNGRFDGNLEALKEIAWGGKEREIAIDRLSDRFNQPGLVPIMLASQPAKPQAVAAAAPAQSKEQAALGARANPPSTATAKALTASLDSAPKVAVVEPKNGAVIEGENVEIAVQVTDGGGDVDEVRLYHNGRLVEDKGQRAASITTRGGGKRVVQNFQIDLAPGENSIKAIAFSKDRVESEPSEVKVQAKAPSAKSAVHVLAVGINQYKNPSLNLNYGVSDAKGISEFFNRQKQLFGDVKVTEVLDAKATREGILQAVSSMRGTKPEDLVVVYLAGHGETDEEGNWYFIPHELVFPEKQDQLKSIGISGQELQKEIQKLGARKVVLLIDACKSGGAVVTMRGFEERKALRQLARASGVHVVAAAAQDQLAGEIVRLNHGIFTYAVLEALKGGADGAPKDGVVSIREMLSYIETRMPELSQEYRSKAQYPVVDSRGMDFPMASN